MTGKTIKSQRRRNISIKNSNKQSQLEKKNKGIPRESKPNRSLSQKSNHNNQEITQSPQKITRAYSSL